MRNISKTISSLASVSAETSASVKDMIASSYVPKLLVSEGIEVHKEQLTKYIESHKIEVPKDVRDFIENSVMAGLCIPFSMELHSKYSRNFFDWISDISKHIWNFINSILGINQKKKASKAYNNVVQQLNFLFNKYHDEHETLLKKIQKNIDQINRKKPVIKDYILTKLSIKMQELGLDSQVSDYPMEHLDYRLFIPKDEYNLINQEKLELQDEAESLIDYIPQVAIFNVIKTHKLLKKAKELKTKGKYIEQKIQADLKKLELIDIAMDNIANIFHDVANSYIPAMEKILKDIETKYHNCYDNIPDAEISFLFTSSRILKELTERRIIKENFSLNDEKNFTIYSNKLSKNYCELKSKFNESVAA